MAAFATTCRGCAQPPQKFVTLHQIEIVPTGPDPQKDPQFLAMLGSSRQPQRSQPSPTPVQQPQRPPAMGRGTQTHPDARGQQFQPSQALMPQSRSLTSTEVMDDGFHTSHGQPRTQPQPYGGHVNQSPDMAWLDPSAGRRRRNGVPTTEGGLGQFAIEQIIHQLQLAQGQLAQEQLIQRPLAQEQLGQEQFPVGQFAQEQLIQRQSTPGQFHPGRFTQRQPAQQQLGQEQVALGQFAQEQLIQRQIAQGQSIQRPSTPGELHPGRFIQGQPGVPGQVLPPQYYLPPSM